MRSNEIELLSEGRQRRLCVDACDNATNAEKLSRPAEKRFVIGIESETLMAEQTAEIQKISGTAAQVQNVERRRAIKPEVLYALYVYANPVIRILVGVDLSRIRSIWVIFTQSFQFRPIYRGEKPSRIYRVRPAASVLPQTFRRLTGKEFLEFMGNSHRETMQRSRARSSIAQTTA